MKGRSGADDSTALLADERSVSEVVGVVLLLAVVTLLAAVVGLALSGIGNTADHPLSVAAIDITEGDTALELEIEGGVNYDDRLEIRVNGETIRHWEQVQAGDKRYLWCLRPGDEIRIVSDSSQGDTQATIATHEVETKTSCRFRIRQDGMERIVTPLNWENKDSESFYSYGRHDGTGHWHSHIDEDIMESNTSFMFFYEYGNQVSLVIVHDKPQSHCGHGSIDSVEGNCFSSNDEGGGAVNMTFGGIPDGASWAAKDEPWDFTDNDLEETCGGVANVTSPPSRACWFWYSGNADGAVLRGGFSGDVSDLRLDVHATWNRSSVAWGSVGSQDSNDKINRWAFMSGRTDSRDEIELDLNETVTIEGIEDPEPH